MKKSIIFATIIVLIVILIIVIYSPKEEEKETHTPIGPNPKISEYNNIDIEVTSSSIGLQFIWWINNNNSHVIKVDDNKDFSSPIIKKGSIRENSRYSFAFITEKLSPGRYYWIIESLNSSEKSSIFNFTIKPSPETTEDKIWLNRRLTQCSEGFSYNEGSIKKYYLSEHNIKIYQVTLEEDPIGAKCLACTCASDYLLNILVDKSQKEELIEMGFSEYKL